MAARKVFQTVELLELILLLVPQIDVFVMQRINKTFNSTIVGSGKLRRKMFLAVKEPKQAPEFPLTSFAAVAAAYDAKRAHTRYPTSKNYHPEMKLLSTYFSSAVPSGALFLWQFQLAPFRMWNIEVPVLILGQREHDDDETIGWQGKTAVHANGSWRKMVLGAVSSEVVVEVQCKTDLSVIHTRRSIPAGASLGDLFDILEELREKVVA